jgi:hypothetical protein
LSLIPYICDLGDAAASEIANVASDAIKFVLGAEGISNCVDVLADVGDYDVGTFARECPCERSSLSARASGDVSNLTIQLAQGISSFSGDFTVPELDARLGESN